ncbi:hypothetical protein GLAREA_12474 [Glarea lozoyensis ATCC 20868]|uniref:Uncharacterized protein n=1 Tax=Glarea lozoyensis (strain ATCC 20868 / MF5171) TaxID=1116229 RepID=S3DZH5_GLAL2|nr:uncharacterized protein GLAREA_12474 [Glarea lozoyensis ATCC 20868]EPE31718.1 hypothetical protein GLAREA_12474 [Glarea lozoyensis ATCC 20868]
MASILAPNNPPPRLTEFALRRHTRAKEKALRTRSEIENAPSSTDLDAWAEELEKMGGKTHISIDSEERERLRARGRRFHKFINGVERREKSPVPMHATDDRPIWMRTMGRKYPEANIPKSVHEITPPRHPAEMFRSQSANLLASLDNDTSRLIKSISAEGEQSLEVVVSHMPQFRHVRNHGEMGSYIDQSQYVICMGSGPLRDLQYGIIIVPIGEEQMMFRPEHEYRDKPISNRQEPQHHAAILQDSDPDPASQVRPPQGHARNNNEDSFHNPNEPPPNQNLFDVPAPEPGNLQKIFADANRVWRPFGPPIADQVPPIQPQNKPSGHGGLFGGGFAAAFGEKQPPAQPPKRKTASSRVTKKVSKRPAARSQPKKNATKAKRAVNGAKKLAPQPTTGQRRSPRANAGQRAT